MEYNSKLYKTLEKYNDQASVSGYVNHCIHPDDDCFQMILGQQRALRRLFFADFTVEPSNKISDIVDEISNKKNAMYPGSFNWGSETFLLRQLSNMKWEQNEDLLQ